MGSEARTGTMRTGPGQWQTGGPGALGLFYCPLTALCLHESDGVKGLALSRGKREPI